MSDKNLSNSNFSEVPPCPECGGLRGRHANRRCSLMTLEYAQQEIINVEQKWIKHNADIGSNWQKDRNKLKKIIASYQGKVAVLKHENNQLRKKSSKININNAPPPHKSPLVEALEQYIKVLGEELDEVTTIAATFGWKSSKIEIGKQLRDKIENLKMYC